LPEKGTGGAATKQEAARRRINERKNRIEQITK